MALTLTLPAQHTQPALEGLETVLLHDDELPGLDNPTEDLRRLTLHPRIDTLNSLPERLRALGVELQGTWGTRDLRLTPRQRTRLFTVVFFSKSKPSPPLGLDLPRTWRRILSNFHLSDLELEGARYASVEHAFQATKALCSTRPEMASWFHLDFTGPEAVPPDPAAARKQGGRGAYTRANAVLDVDAWNDRRVDLMQAAVAARWEQQPLFRAVLESTQGLELLHFERAGARSFWGCSISRKTGEVQGENMLGRLLMERRDA